MLPLLGSEPSHPESKGKLRKKSNRLVKYATLNNVLPAYITPSEGGFVLIWTWLRCSLVF